MTYPVNISESCDLVLKSKSAKSGVVEINNLLSFVVKFKYFVKSTLLTWTNFSTSKREINHIVFVRIEYTFLKKTTIDRKDAKCIIKKSNGVIKLMVQFVIIY